MQKQDRFDSLFQYYSQGTCFDWKLFKWMALVESSMEPYVVSEAGAMGLMQLMPDTAEEMSVVFALSADENVRGGIDYFRIQFEHFPEIPDRMERIKFSLAAYNGGRGYTNVATSMGRDFIKKAMKLAKLRELRHDDWQKWDVVKKFLKFPSCKVKGKRPDYKQIISYVKKVMDLYEHEKSV